MTIEIAVMIGNYFVCGCVVISLGLILARSKVNINIDKNGDNPSPQFLDSNSDPFVG